MNALIIGRDHGLAWALPQLLTRAGFSVDAIISSPLMKRCKFLRNCFLVPHTRSLIPTIAEKMNKGYDWIVITEDGPLTEVLESNLSVEDKLKILPVQAPENFIHLYSKIGLSKVFSDQGVPTPPSAVAKTITEALSEANRLGYPILLKQDSSGGGSGIFEAHSAADLKTLQPQFFQKPVLVQKQIPGIEVDLSPLYFHGKLIHFNYAKIEKTTSRFGPSSVRTYSPLSRVDEQVFRELAHIGKVLGAHGFVNMSCIESEGRRFYFEADMRPNAWVEFPRFFSEDPAIRIRNWFLNKETL
ncbi:MAG TPA: hypothetical protein VLF94_04055, partial [Chlamydiales bacterium]|nr:hypothetical protein [Chlamydiales bacterium]